nr:hypothetical protein [Sedimentibacter sp.]
MKKTISLIMVLTILLSFGLKATAVEKGTIDISPMWTNLITLGTTLSIDSSGQATCTGNMTQNLTDGTCILVMNLQKLDSNNSWNTIATWTKKGSTKCVNTTYKNISKGTYRLSLTGKVYNSYGNFIESGTINSINKTY